MDVIGRKLEHVLLNQGKTDIRFPDDRGSLAQRLELWFSAEVFVEDVARRTTMTEVYQRINDIEAIPWSDCHSNEKPWIDRKARDLRE